MGARFLLLAVVCIALMLLDRRDQHLVRVRQALSVVVYPVRVLVDLPFSTWGKARDTFASRDALIAENRQFRRERLETEGRACNGSTRSKPRTRGCASCSTRRRAIGSRALVAEILAVDLDPYRQRFDLNRGLVDGVYVGPSADRRAGRRRSGSARRTADLRSGA